MPGISDYGLVQGISMNFVQGWEYSLYTTMFENDSNSNPTSLSLVSLVNCTWNSSTQKLTPSIGYTNFSFRLQGSSIDITGFAYPVLWDNISVSLLKSTLGITDNNYAAIFTSPNINPYSRYLSNNTVPHSASEFRGYCHSADGRHDMTVDRPYEVPYNSSYNINVLVQKQQNTANLLNYKIEIYRSGSLVNSVTNQNLNGIFFQKHSFSLSNPNSGNNTNTQHAVKIYSMGESGYVENTGESESFNIELQGIPIYGSYLRGTTLSKSISFTLYITNQTGSQITLYPRALVNKSGTEYLNTNLSNPIYVNDGVDNQFLNVVLQYEQLSGLTGSDAIVHFYLETSGGQQYSLTNGSV